MPSPGIVAVADTENTMIVEKSKVVSFHYTLKNAEGEQMESSREKEPMSYLHGANNIISGLEQAMEGREAGDEFSVTVTLTVSATKTMSSVWR